MLIRQLPIAAIEAWPTCTVRPSVARNSVSELSHDQDHWRSRTCRSKAPSERHKTLIWGALRGRATSMRCGSSADCWISRRLTRTPGSVPFQEDSPSRQRPYGTLWNLQLAPKLRFLCLCACLL